MNLPKIIKSTTIEANIDYIPADCAAKLIQNICKTQNKRLMLRRDIVYGCIGRDTITGEPKFGEYHEFTYYLEDKET